MPVINKPPIGLTDQEILCVIAYLQTLGGTPTVTLQTSHHYYTARGRTGRDAGCCGPWRRAGQRARPGRQRPRLLRPQATRQARLPLPSPPEGGALRP